MEQKINGMGERTMSEQQCGDIYLLFSEFKNELVIQNIEFTYIEFWKDVQLKYAKINITMLRGKISVFYEPNHDDVNSDFHPEYIKCSYSPILEDMWEPLAVWPGTQSIIDYVKNNVLETDPEPFVFNYNTKTNSTSTAEQEQYEEDKQAYEASGWENYPFFGEEPIHEEEVTYDD